MLFLAFSSSFLGACLGSFALVLAERTMQEKKWWGMSRSVCDACGKTLCALELVPVFSYLALKGRCKNCGAKIPKSCLWVEITGAVCGLLFALRFQNNLFALSLCHTALLFLTVSTVTDIKSGYIYDNWAFAGCFTPLLLRLAFGGVKPLLDGVLAAGFGFTLMFIIYICSRNLPISNRRL